jgi:hypothetical protein
MLFQRIMCARAATAPSCSGFTISQIHRIMCACPNSRCRYSPGYIYYGDVHVGTIAIRAGVPVDVDQWGWSCGFYPGTKPRQDSDGTAETFEQARIDFETAWNDLLPTLTEANFDRWRDAREWTERKYAMWKAGERMPSQKPSSMMRCPCGETFDSHRLEHTLIHVPHITKAHQADEVHH